MRWMTLAFLLGLAAGSGVAQTSSVATGLKLWLRADAGGIGFEAVPECRVVVTGRSAGTR